MFLLNLSDYFKTAEQEYHGDYKEQFHLSLISFADRHELFCCRLLSHAPKDRNRLNKKSTPF
jgi:hypothetical protein